MSRGTVFSGATPLGGSARGRSTVAPDAWTVMADEAYQHVLDRRAASLAQCERQLVTEEAELAGLQDGTITIKHPLRRQHRLAEEIESTKHAIVSLTEQLAQPRPDVSKRLAAERADQARFEAELAELKARIGERTAILAERHERQEIEYRLFHAQMNIDRLATKPDGYLYHPEPVDPVAAARVMQELVLASTEKVTVSLVTQGTNHRGEPRVQLSSPVARYRQVSKLTAVEARSFGEALLAGAAQLAGEPPVPAAGSDGPQEKTLASCRNAYADLIEKGETGRAKRRISLHLHGCRYPFSLDAEQARTLGLGLIDGAALFEANV